MGTDYQFDYVRFFFFLVMIGGAWLYCRKRRVSFTSVGGWAIKSMLLGALLVLIATIQVCLVAGNWEIAFIYSFILFGKVSGHGAGTSIHLVGCSYLVIGIIGLAAQKLRMKGDNE
jgi:hypothetical protein